MLLREEANCCQNDTDGAGPGANPDEAEHWLSYSVREGRKSTDVYVRLCLYCTGRMSVRAVSVLGASLSLCTRSLCWPHSALQAVSGAGPVRLQLVHLGWLSLSAVILKKESAQQPRPELLTTVPFIASAEFLRSPHLTLLSTS